MDNNKIVQMPVKQVVNQRLNEVESLLGRAYVSTMPTYLTLVLGNGCNIDCLHCYQIKNGDNLLRDPDIAIALRRELSALYPFLSTLRIQGGEIFALRGFKALLEDIAAVVDRPLISISTNGILMDKNWAQMMVEMPFQSVTVSLDAATPHTYAKLRRGGQFDTVINNLQQLQTLKQQYNSELPSLDSFFVIMRSNYHEIPDYLQLMHCLGIQNIVFQTLLTDARNLSREPSLKDEILSDASDVHKLHEILQEVVTTARSLGQRLTWSGLKSLFNQYQLDADFLSEENATLTPNKLKTEVEAAETQNPAGDGLAMPQYIYPDVPSIPTELVNAIPAAQCMNPWKTLFITEHGDVSLCFLSEPIGNLFETPITELWNCPAAIAKRSRILAGQYTASGCSSHWCDWRDGTPAHSPDAESWHELLRVFKNLTTWLKVEPQITAPNPPETKLGSVRRLLDNKQQRIAELEANLSLLWDDNMHLHQAGQAHITALENRIAADEQRIAALEQRLAVYQRLFRPIIWLKHKLL